MSDIEAVLRVTKIELDDFWPNTVTIFAENTGQLHTVDEIQFTWDKKSHPPIGSTVKIEVSW